MFYVYRLDRPWNGVPCYIGKGSGRRYAHHAKLGPKHYNKHLASIYRKAGDVPVPVTLIAEGLTEDEAFALEIKLIAEIGRKDQGKGPLANWTDGGEGLSNPPPETRAKMAAGISAAWTDERHEVQKARKGTYTHSAAVRAKIKARPKRVQSEEEKARRRAAWTPEKKAARAAMMTAEKRAEMSALVLAAYTPAVRAKVLDATMAGLAAAGRSRKRS